ncbi:MAG: glycosyltransferase family 4 protein [Gemmatimonadaceae bacterium]
MRSRRHDPSLMRIAIFTDTYAPNVNGVARTLARLTTALETRGHVSRVYTVGDPRALPDDAIVRWPGVPFWGYPELRLAAPGGAAVRAHLKLWAPTLVHVATPFGVGLAGASAAARLDLPFVSSYHTSFSQYAHYYGFGALAAPGWRYLRWFHNRGRRTYVPTRAVTGELAQHGFERLRVWPRGIDADVFNPRWRADELRRSWGASAESVVVAYVGRLAKEKGVDVAVDAMNRVRERCAHTRFVVVGDGPHESAMRARAPRETTFTGRLSGAALSAAYASADILLFPSTTDTFGNVLLEGMASRLAVIAADTPQSREVCGRGTAEFFEPGSARDLSERLCRLAMSPRERESVRDRALEHASARDWDAVFDTLFADYEVVSRDGAPVAVGRLGYALHS